MPASILHNNGQTRALVDRGRLTPNLGPVFCRLLERQLLATGDLERRTGRPRDLDVVLCSTRSAKQYTEKMLDALGIDDYIVLGRHLADWKHIYKIQLVLEHIDRHPEPELLLHLDATDVLVVGDLQFALDTFRASHNCDLLFGAEKGSAPGSSTALGITRHDRQFLERIEEFERRTYAPPFCHLNAGCFIGRKQAIREIFTETLRQRSTWGITTVLPSGLQLEVDDQLILREAHRTNHPRVLVDHRCTIFQSLFAIRRSELNVDLRVPGGAAFVAAFCGHFAALLARRARRSRRARR